MPDRNHAFQLLSSTRYHQWNRSLSPNYYRFAKDENYSFKEIAQLLEDVKQQLNRDYPITMEIIGMTPDCSIYNKLNDITARFNALKEDLWLISGLPAEWLTLAG